MADESHSFASTRARLEDIVTQVRKKDTSLEKSLDLLEEGVRLANACTELIDHQDWVNGPPSSAEGSAPAAEASAVTETAAQADEATGVTDGEPAMAEADAAVDVEVEVTEEVVFVDGEVVAEVFEVSAFASDAGGGAESDISASAEAEATDAAGEDEE